MHVKIILNKLFFVYKTESIYDPKKYPNKTMRIIWNDNEE